LCECDGLQPSRLLAGVIPGVFAAEASRVRLPATTLERRQSSHLRWKVDCIHDFYQRWWINRRRFLARDQSMLGVSSSTHRAATSGSLIFKITQQRHGCEAFARMQERNPPLAQAARVRTRPWSQAIYPADLGPNSKAAPRGRQAEP
jgi:hypothetical protein